MKKLPKAFRGAEVVRGRGMSGRKTAALIEKKALRVFDATREMWLVVEDDALEDSNDKLAIDIATVRGFTKRSDAIRYARALSEGNVDHRVLHVTGQILVVATRNEL